METSSTSSRNVSTPERVAIVGSREWPYHEALRVEAEIRAYVESLPPGTVIVSGGARGVDTWAIEAAKNCGLPYKVHSPEKYAPKGAPRHLYIRALFMRNSDIAEDCTRLVAWQRDELSKGTEDTIQKVHNLKKPYEVRG